MRLGWIIASAIVGAVLLLLHTAAVARKAGDYTVLKKPVLILVLGGLGAFAGWFALYYGPLALYRGAIAFVNLYNDSRRPLLLLVPQLIGIAVAFPLAFGGAKAWRGSVKAQNEKLDRLSRNDLFLSLALWFAAFCALIVGIYFSLEMRRTS